MNILGCVIVDQTAVYISVPITSGWRLADWVNSRKVQVDLSNVKTYVEFQRKVLEPNYQHAQNIIRNLRKQFTDVVIDPTAFRDVEGWSQNDYRYLWGRVIEQYVGTVVFIDGWQYSNGCSYEFLVAVKCSDGGRRSLLNERLEPLTLEIGLSLIEKAIAEMKKANTPTEFLEQVAWQLSQAVSSARVGAE